MKIRLALASVLVGALAFTPALGTKAFARDHKVDVSTPSHDDAADAARLLAEHQRHSIGNYNNQSWAGYGVITFRGSHFTAVRGKFVVPNFDCSSGHTTFASLWVGLDGFYVTPTVEQAGVDLECYQGRRYVYAWTEMYPAAPVIVPAASLNVNIGHTVVVNITRSGASFGLQLNDATTAKQYRVTSTCNSCQASTAEWIMEAPGGQGATTRLTPFNRAYFTESAAAVNGRTGVINDTNIGAAYRINMTGANASTNYTKTYTSGLYVNNNAFYVDWKSQW